MEKVNTSNKSFVAVYGSLRKTMGNHYILASSEFIGEAKEEVPYYMIDLGFFPALIKDYEKKNPIVFEVYNVKDFTLSTLDYLEGFRGEKDPGNFYDRTTIKLTIDGKEYDCYVYYLQGGEFKKNKNIVSSGDWVLEYLKLTTLEKIKEQ